MSTVQDCADSIAATAADYRKDELGPFTAPHVIHWADQFDERDRLPLQAELDHVLKKTYFSEVAVSDFLKSLAKAPNVVGADPVA
jgi:thiamine biosynthesis lipoprotein ApbE